MTRPATGSTPRATTGEIARGLHGMPRSSDVARQRHRWTASDGFVLHEIANPGPESRAASFMFKVKVEDI